MSMQFTGKYVSLTTFRRDGTPVSTPVWFVSENGSLLVETDGDSYKVKRIRSNDSVTVTSCNAMGRRVTGEVVSARATILPAEERPRVERLLRRKYRLDYIFVLPIYLLVQRLRNRPLALREACDSFDHPDIVCVLRLACAGVPE
jgi:PPOX class probable F420-dependent enzyme